MVPIFFSGHSDLSRRTPFSSPSVMVGYGSNLLCFARVYVHREGLPLSLLKDGLEKLKYEEVVKALIAAK